MQEYTRVMSKKPGHHLCNLLKEFPKEVFMDYKIITPIHALKMVLRNIEDDIFSRVE